MTWLERFLFESVCELGGKHYGATGSATTNCSRYIARMLQRMYPNRITSPSADWERLMIQDPSQPFSPIECAVDLGLAERVDHPPPGRVCLVQGWRVLDGRGWVPHPSPVPNGHSFFFRRNPIPMSGSSWLLNANTSRPWGKRITWGEASGPYTAGVEVCALKEI